MCNRTVVSTLYLRCALSLYLTPPVYALPHHLWDIPVSTLDAWIYGLVEWSPCETPRLPLKQTRVCHVMWFVVAMPFLRGATLNMRSHFLSSLVTPLLPELEHTWSAHLLGGAQMPGRDIVVGWRVPCWRVTRQHRVATTAKDSKNSGKHIEAIVPCVARCRTFPQGKFRLDPPADRW